VALFFAAGEPALAQTAPWRVSEASGDVRIVEGGRSRPATRGALLSGGSIVATAQRARAVLVRGRDYVIVSPASRVRVPTAAQGGSRGLIQMITEAGTAMFRIEHRATPHFAVQTPYLAAVVKGTIFTVTVGEAGASVQVTEGAVEVSTADGGAAEMIRPGMIATVSAADLQQLDIQGENSRSIRSNGTPAAGALVVPPAETGNYQGSDSQVAIAAAVTEEPVALAEITDGLVAGNAGVDLALVDARDAARPGAGGNGDAGNDASGPGTANGDGNGGATATPGNDDAGNAGNAGDGDNSGSGVNAGSGDAANSGGGDGNNGHGNDDDGDDASNPGNGGGSDNSGPGNTNGGGDDAASGDDGNNGHGNDDDGDDAGNPGNGGSGNPGGNDDADGGDDGNNGHGNDDDGDDDSNPGNGGGNDNSGPGNNNGGGNGGGHGGDDPD
jgi:hypothetical protein